MFKKFIEGAIFGSGFILIIVLAWFAFSSYFVSTINRSDENLPSYRINTTPEGLPKPKNQSATKYFEKDGKQFHEFSIEEKIQKASVIALAKYEKADDGKMKAIITEFLKKDANTEIYYKVGDEYSSSSYYPSDKHGHGDGVVIFFVGSPAEMRSAASYYGDRIAGLSDIPIKLFRKKCEAMPST
jgi:hypothetical protein